MNVEKLKQVIEESRFTRAELAEKLGISREGLYYKLEHPSAFTVEDVRGFEKALKLSRSEIREIFF